MSDLKKLLPHELATLLSVNRRSISRWSKSENLPKNGDGTFDGPACVRWLTERLEARTEAECDKPVPGAEWLNEYRRVRFMREELQLKLDQAELLPVSEVTKENAKKFAMVVDAMRNLPVRIAPQLCGMTDRVEIGNVIDLEVAAMQAVLASGRWYSAEAVETAIAEMGGMSPRQALAEKVEAQRSMPLHMRYDPRKRVFTDTRDGTLVPLAEAEVYVRTYPNSKPKTQQGEKKNGATNVTPKNEPDSKEKKNEQ